jgi:hypothetical protein
VRLCLLRQRRLVAALRRGIALNGSSRKSGTSRPLSSAVFSSQTTVLFLNPSSD